MSSTVECNSVAYYTIPDLYVRFGAQPTTTSYNYRPYLNGNEETCSFATPASGTWYISIRTYSSFSGVTLNAQATP